VSPFPLQTGNITFYCCVSQTQELKSTTVSKPW